MNCCTDTVSLERLRAFGAALYAAVPRRADALCELTDAVWCAGMVGSLPHRSVEAVPRRGGGRLYDARAAGRIAAAVVEDLRAAHPLPSSAPRSAVDASVWARCDAQTSAQRGLYDHPSRHSAGQPSVAGGA